MNYKNSIRLIKFFAYKLSNSLMKLPLVFLATLLFFSSFIMKLSIWGHYSPYSIYLFYSISIVSFILSSFTTVSSTIEFNWIQKIFITLLLFLSSYISGIPNGIGMLLLGIYTLLSFKKGKTITLFKASILSTMATIISVFIINTIPSFHEMNWFAKIISFILNILGISTYCDNNNLNSVIFGETYSFAVTYEQTGFWYFIIAISITIFLSLIDFNKSKSIKLLCITLFSSILYFIFRYIIIINLYTLINNIVVFYSPLITILSWLPWTIIYYLLLKKSNIEYHEDNILIKKINSKKLQIISTLIILLLLFSSCFLFMGKHYTFGNYKNGKIFIDELHSKGWESITEPLNTKKFSGQKSTYTYYSFVEYLKLLNNTEVILNSDSYKKISPNDILIIKTPTVDFSSDEISTIQNFVYNGGGLLLIGDHTNLFDMSRRLNQIAKPFNLSFRYDSAYDLETTGLTEYDTSYNLYFPNIINNVLNQYKFATSCTIKSGLFSKKILVGNNLASERLDISHPNFFGDLSLSESEMFGLFEQCTSMEYGKGRVIAFSDSTTFSSYSVFMHNNPEFISAIIDYLNRTNSNNIFLYIGFVSLFTSIFLIYKFRNKISLKNVIIFFILFLPLTFSFSNSVLQSIFNINKERIKTNINSYETVYFLRSDEEKPLSHFVSFGNNKEQYSSFFLAFQRLGFFTRESKNLNEILNSNIKLLIVTDPNAIKSHEIHLVDNFIYNGGKILLLYKENMFDKYSQILSFFNITYKPILQSVNISETITGNEKKILQYINYLPTSPYEAKIKSSNDIINLRLDTYNFNNGSLSVLFSSELLDNISLGDPGNPATAEQIKQHKALYDLLDDLIK